MDLLATEGPSDEEGFVAPNRSLWAVSQVQFDFSLTGAYYGNFKGFSARFRSDFVSGPHPFSGTRKSVSNPKP